MKETYKPTEKEISLFKAGHKEGYKKGVKEGQIFSMKVLKKIIKKSPLDSFTKYSIVNMIEIIEKSI